MNLLHKPQTSDWLASLVVFLVALPLSIGISVASGADVKAGLFAAIIGGVVVGFFGGAPLQVSGPAAGLIVMVAGYIQQFSFASVGLVIAGAGMLQMLAGVSGVSRVALAISPPVLDAMLAGIGVVIAIGQLQTLLGFAPQPRALDNLTSTLDHIMNANGQAVIVGVVTLVCLVLWNRFGAKRIKSLPGALVAITAGSLVAALMGANVKYVQVPADPFGSFTLPVLGEHSWAAIVVAALGLAFVASAESLLSALATDQMHTGPRANLDRELFAQGLANTTSGLVGGLPITGVIVRSTANIQAGGKTKWSAILHGVWILVFLVFLSAVIAKIPLPALAALLIHIGVKLVKPDQIKHAIHYREAHVFFGTMFGVVFVDLLTGIGIGIALTVITHFVHTRATDLKAQLNVQNNVVTLAGAPSFMTIPNLSKQLSAIPAGQTLSLQLQPNYMDQSAVEALANWKNSYVKSGGVVAGDDPSATWTRVRSHASGAPSSG
jgi:carbonic anhydrase